MIASQAVTMDLFLWANPSLKSVEECTSSLVDGTWYCLHPVRDWNVTVTQQAMLFLNLTLFDNSTSIKLAF